MPQTDSYITFDNAESNVNGPIGHSPKNALNIGSDDAFYGEQDAELKDEVSLTCSCNEAVQDEVNVLEIAFVKGKLRQTKFSVDVIMEDDTKKHVGTYESTLTTNYQKFIFPEKIKGFKGVILKFKGNSDGYPWFSVKGVRMAKFVRYS